LGWRASGSGTGAFAGTKAGCPTTFSVPKFKVHQFQKFQGPSILNKFNGLETISNDYPTTDEEGMSRGGGGQRAMQDAWRLPPVGGAAPASPFVEAFSPCVRYCHPAFAITHLSLTSRDQFAL